MHHCADIETSGKYLITHISKFFLQSSSKNNIGAIPIYTYAVTNGYVSLNQLRHKQFVMSIYIKRTTQFQKIIKFVNQQNHVTNVV